MSAIYRAFDTVMGRDVALKRLLPMEETNLNEASTGALAREAAALARFQHPNVVTVFAFEEDAEGPFVVMELVEGEDLHSIMKTGALSWEDFSYIAEQCLEPLIAAKDLNLLHRDIKPGNIMLTVTASGRFLVKLLDFGLAKFSQQPSTQTLDHRGSFLGSIDFIAPEQLELKPLDQRTDLYSLGCVFYYMLVQSSPFTGGNPAETSMNHINHRCQPIGEIRRDLPPLVADWIMRLISRRPDDRPADAREALLQFHEAVKGIEFVPLAKIDEETADDIFVIAAPEPVLRPTDGPAASPVHPSGSVPERARGGDPVKPPTGYVSRVKAASEPIPTRRMVTGPVTGAQRPATTSARQSLAPRGGSAPVPGRAASPRPVAGVTNPYLALLRDWKVILGIATGLIVLITVGIFLMTDRSDERPEVTVSAAPVLLPALPMPVALSRADGLPDPPPLPLKDGLFGWFNANKGTYARDYRSSAKPGEQVAAWYNLASDAKERSLLRDGGDSNGTHLPILGRYGPEDFPVLRGVFQGIPTTNRTSLSSLKSDATLPRGFTFIAVLRLEAGEDRLFRLQAPVWDGCYVHFTTGYDSKLSATSRGKSEGPDERISVLWPSGQLGILAYLWNPAAKTHTLITQPAGSLPGVTASGAIQFEGQPLGMMAIGKRGFGDSFDANSGNILFEMVVYNQVLNEQDLKTMMAYFSGRYFVSTK